MSHTLDELTLQRCVDGELNEAEQQALLRQLERSPAGWREVALAFIEQQLWSKAGHDWVHEPAPPLVASPGVAPPVPARSSWIRNTALAASTLLAVGLGYMSGKGHFWANPTSPQGSEIVLAPSHPRGPNTAKTITVSAESPLGTSAAMFPTTAEWPAEGSSPAVPVNDAAVMRSNPPWTAPGLSVEDRQYFEDRGYDIREEPRFYTVPIDNNRQLIVPVHTIRVRQQLQ